jgi:hypothetical protein
VLQLKEARKMMQQLLLANANVAAKTRHHLPRLDWIKLRLAVCTTQLLLSLNNEFVAVINPPTTVNCRLPAAACSRCCFIACKSAAAATRMDSVETSSSTLCPLVGPVLMQQQQLNREV